MSGVVLGMSATADPRAVVHPPVARSGAAGASDTPDTRADTRLSRLHASALFALGFAIAMLGAGPAGIARVFGGHLVNPDSYMRLVRIEDELRAGHLLFAVARDDLGRGTVLHWSHLLDALLVALAAPSAPVLGWHRALFAAGALSGPVSVGLLGLALAWAVAPVAPRRWLWTASAAAATAPSVIGYGGFGVAHHHILLVALVALASGLAGRAALGPERGRLRAARAAGIAGGVGIWLTPETMPPMLICFGAIALAWMIAPGRLQARAALANAAAFAATLLAAWVVDPPPDRWAFEVDRISLVFCLLGVALMAAAAAMRKGRRPVAIAVAALALGAWLAAFPAIARGPAGLVTGDDVRIMLASISEMRRAATLQEAGAYAGPGVIASLCCLVWGVRGRDPFWLYGAAAALSAALLAAHYVRFAPFPESAAAAVLPVALARASTIPRAGLRPFARIGVVAGFVLLPLAPALLASDAGSVPDDRVCDIAAASSYLGRHPGAVVLASPDLTPELLYRAPVRTAGSLFFRNAAAFARLRAAWRAEPGPLPSAPVLALEPDYAVFCRGALRNSLVLDLPAHTLWDALAAGRPPQWLRLVQAGRDGGVDVYAFAPRASAPVRHDGGGSR